MSVRALGTSAADIIYSPWQLNSCNSLWQLSWQKYQMTFITQTSTALIVSAQYCCFANVLNGYCTFIDHIPMTFRTYINSLCCLWLSQVYRLSNYNSILWPSKNGSLVWSICGLNLAPVAAQICMSHWPSVLQSLHVFLSVDTTHCTGKLQLHKKLYFISRSTK